MGTFFLMIGGHGKRWDAHSTIAVQIKGRIIEKPVTEFLQTNVASPNAPNGLSSGLFVQQDVDNLPSKLSNSLPIFIFYIEEHTMNNHLRLGYIGVAIMLVSCGSPATPVPATPNLQATVQVMVADVVRAQPSQTPYPTYTVIPTDTPTPTPEGTATPTATPTQPPSPTPDPRLFWDDFENGIKPDWHMQGEYTLVNGRLNMGKAMEGYVGDATWSDYAIELSGVENSCGNINLITRLQDRDNYLVAHFGWGCAGQIHTIEWGKMVNGKETRIEGAVCAHGLNGPVHIELQGNSIRAFVNGERCLYFTDNSFPNGSVGLTSSGGASIDGFEVLRLP